MPGKVNILERYLNRFDWENLLYQIITKLIVIILITILFVLIFKIGQKIIQHLYSSYAQKTSIATGRVATIKKMIDSVFYYSVFFIALYTLLAIIGVPIGSLLTGAGIVGLALGLGAQGFMNDLITGFFIILEQQIDVGDQIKLENLNIEGVAIAVGIRTTKIKSPEGFIHFVPNRNITTITNLSRSD
jgi:small conductance mechanosensitive channel